MKQTKSNSIYESEKDNCLFVKQFEQWETLDWNKDIPPFFKRLNQIKDDRSFVILATSVIEYQIDRFLKAFIPKCEILVNDKTNLSTKVNIIQAFNLIPEHFPLMLNNIRNIRNDFAHNLNIDGFDDAHKSEKLLAHIDEMKCLWHKFENDMCYWSSGKPIRLMFKDLCRVSLEGLRVFESSIRLFRLETENQQFIESLCKLSADLKSKRENVERESIKGLLRLNTKVK